jgi:hypothetical protein
VSLVADLLLIAGGFVVVRWVAKKLRPGRSAEPTGEQAPSPQEVLPTLPFQLGDVVVRTMERDEAWLRGALVFEEERPVAALFVAPEAGSDRALFVQEGDAGLLWLSPLLAGAPTVAGDPPSTLEREGLLFERARRLPVHVRQVGAGAPAVGDRAVVAVYAGPSAGRIVVVIGSQQTLSWLGVALGKGDYDVLPGGSAAT